MINRPSLTDEQAEALYDSVLHNADVLCRSANALLDIDSIAAARSLVVLALEESGKAILLHQARSAAWHSGSPAPDLDQRFWKRWGDHLKKLETARNFLVQEDYWFDSEPPPTHELLLGPIEDYIRSLQQWAKQGNVDKQRGLYVDLNQKGEIEEPDYADAEAVRSLMALVDQIGWQVRLGDHIQRKQGELLNSAKFKADQAAFDAEVEEAGGFDSWSEKMEEGGWDGYFERAIEKAEVVVDSPEPRGRSDIERLNDRGWEAYRRAVLG